MNQPDLLGMDRSLAFQHVLMIHSSSGMAIVFILPLLSLLSSYTISLQLQNSNKLQSFKTILTNTQGQTLLCQNTPTILSHPFLITFPRLHPFLITSPRFRLWEAWTPWNRYPAPMSHARLHPFLVTSPRLRLSIDSSNYFDEEFSFISPLQQVDDFGNSTKKCRSA